MNEYDLLHDIMLRSFQAQSSFSRHLTIVSATLLGILTAFHPDPSTPLLPRILFLSAILLLAVAIFLLLSLSNAYTALLHELYQKIRASLQCATPQHIQVPSTPGKAEAIRRKSTAAYTLLSLSIILLVIYAGIVIIR